MAKVTAEGRGGGGAGPLGEGGNSHWTPERQSPHSAFKVRWEKEDALGRDGGLADPKALHSPIRPKSQEFLSCARCWEELIFQRGQAGEGTMQTRLTEMDPEAG